MIFGHTSVGGSTLELPIDTKRVSRYTLSQTRLASKLCVYCDGDGAGVGEQVARAVVYDADGALVAVSDEVTILDGQDAAWVDFPLPAAVELVAGDYDLGVISGGVTMSARIYHDTGGTGQHNADTYTDGPADPFGSPTGNAHKLSVFVQSFEEFVHSDNVDDDYLASLGFSEAQEAFSVTSPIPGSDERATVGWHGTAVDPRRGSYGIVQKDGDFTEWVGERVKVTWNERSVIVYVTDERDIDEDFSLARRAFLALEPLAADEVDAVVEIMGADDAAE